jgi:hypothetical protein
MIGIVKAFNLFKQKRRIKSIPLSQITLFCGEATPP